MKKSIVLAEKPSVGRDLARVLKCNRKNNGYIEGQKYIVTWGLGHLVTLAEPEKYNQKYKSWNLEDLPMLPSNMKLEVIKRSKKQFYTVKNLMKRKDIKEIIIATDAGREGELVARWIIEKANVKRPIKRLWISSVTDKGIRDGFKKLKDGREYENLYHSAVARAEADWIVGINATRALTCKYNAQLSCGRVQSPTLSMIYKREEEIKNFKPKAFYGIKLKGDGLQLTWQDSGTRDTKTFNKEKRDRIVSKIKDKKGEILAINKSRKKSYSPKLYDLTELQRDANRIFDFSAKETLSIMQNLYERHKILTYPRTDSRYITTDMVDTLKDRVKACGLKGYRSITGEILKGKIKANKSFVDNNKVSDHHAIIPTEETVILSDLSNKERKIYDLVIKRFLSVLYKPFEYEKITLKAKIEDEIFISSGKRVLSKGWKELYDNKDTDSDVDSKVFTLKKGDSISISNIESTKGETNPPEPFNEGTLLSAMENPTRYMKSNDKSLVKTIGNTGGLGTVATRADIIEKLFKSFLIEKKGKKIYITSKGKQLLDLVPEGLKSPELTAKWEQKLSDISKGKLNKNSFVNEMTKYAKEVVGDIKKSDRKFKHDNLTRNKCPECGKFMLKIKNNKGTMLICQDRECGYRKGIAKKTNARCPNCHKKMELRGEGEGKIFACKCGHREKLSSFEKRKKKQKNKMSKKEARKYLKKQDDKPINSALADALANIKID